MIVELAIGIRYGWKFWVLLNRIHRAILEIDSPGHMFQLQGRKPATVRLRQARRDVLDLWEVLGIAHRHNEDKWFLRRQLKLRLCIDVVLGTGLLHLAAPRHHSTQDVIHFRVRQAHVEGFQATDASTYCLDG